MSGALNQTVMFDKPTVRTVTGLDLAMRAWGSEYHAPDHDIYKFSNGKGYDSTDASQGGPYSPTHP
jgi:hypothetical protein